MDADAGVHGPVTGQAVPTSSDQRPTLADFFSGWAVPNPNPRSLRHTRNANAYDRVVAAYAKDGMDGERAGLGIYTTHSRRLSYAAFQQARAYGLGWHDMAAAAKGGV